MKLKWSALLVPVLLLACTTASADDGEKTLKEMTVGNVDPQLAVTPGEVGMAYADAEHAFIDMMKFYVPAQAANGTPFLPLEYNNVQDQLVETLGVAKPLISVFIYGPTIHVEDTAFAHSYMDAFAAVSLDDGLTWKKTNLSESADLSSFTLGVDGIGDSGDDGHDIPVSHTEVEKDDGLIAFHAPGMDYPYSNMCTDCHGNTLEGGHHSEPSCYSCHGPEWKEDAPDDVMVVYIEEAYAKLESVIKIKIDVEGEVEGVDDKTSATLINGVTDFALATEMVEDDGEFEFEFTSAGLPPCTVAVVVDGVESATIPVIDKRTNEPVENCEGEPHDLTIYPGGVYNVFHATAGNKVLVAWPSRYCQQGQPAFSFAYDADPDELATDPNAIKRQQIVDYLNADGGDFDVTEDLYLTDLFGVAGSQRSIDFADEGYPQAGEVPFGCVWTARGVLLPGDDPRTTDVNEESHMVWTKAERLTSGRRDPNRIEVKGVKGAGFVITWQEDPDGLRPGQGLGPGEGWSGAVAHDKTDVWYSFIPWEHFDIVKGADVAPDPINIAEHDLLLGGRPQVFVPMAVPMRLTNNDKCNAEFFGPEGSIDPTDPRYFSYCNVDVASFYGLQDFCATTVQVPTGQSGELADICVNEDGLPNIANTASTRPRTSLQGYDVDNDGVFDSAWVIVAAEESKGLGSFALDDDGYLCEDPEDPLCDADIGKNQWYFSFDMGEPRTSDTMSHANGLVQNLVNQGNMLNQPEVNWQTGEFYPPIDTSASWGISVPFYIFNTEIARRSSLLVQSIAKARASDSDILATPSWKQGVMRQGGPADTMLRRFVLPDGYQDGIDNNPYAFENMECNAWMPEGENNPYYPGGVCADSAINLSSVVPDTCIDDGADGASIACPTVAFTGATFGIGDTDPILRGVVQGAGNTTRVLTWHQCPSDGTVLASSDGLTPVSCDAEGTIADNLSDQSWYNPLDISKGHRGFIDGDFVMFLYAWSPNWRLNAKGSDRYDLYIRRSFDGGMTWTTTPGALGGDGTVTCESYRTGETQDPDATEPRVCYEYGTGGAEQARNVTQHSKMKYTTLDPRYAATPASITETCLDGLAPSDTEIPFDMTNWVCDDGSVSDGTRSLDSDLRDPSRFFIVFETGDNSTVKVGEAEPEDLFYGRAEGYGDDYVVWTETDTGFDADPTAVCYPSVPYDDASVDGTVVVGSGFCNEFERMNAKSSTHASEANLEANPAGSKLYGVWAQTIVEVIDEINKIEETIDSEASVRRLWWIDSYRSTDSEDTWILQGTNQSQ